MLKSHGRRSLVGYSPWGGQESDTTERLHFRFSLSCIGEGSGNPLQCSCLENPMDRGAWSAAVYGVAQGWTRLKHLSSSSSSAQIDPGNRGRLADKMLSLQGLFLWGTGVLSLIRRIWRSTGTFRSGESLVPLSELGEVKRESFRILGEIF